MDSRCKRHEYGVNRKSAQERGYDSGWTRLRAVYVRANPLCQIREKCNGDPTEEVDHIIPISDGGARLDENNLQAACRRCHRWKTIHIDQRRARVF